MVLDVGRSWGPSVLRAFSEVGQGLMSTLSLSLGGRLAHIFSVEISSTYLGLTLGTLLDPEVPSNPTIPWFCDTSLLSPRVTTWAPSSWWSCVC